MTTPIDIRPDHLKIVQDILSRHLSPDVKVWVFGSRANWTTKDSSDLDLALEGPAKLDRKVRGALEDAFEDSDLPYTVDIVDMNQVSDTFREIVEAQKKDLPQLNDRTDRRQDGPSDIRIEQATSRSLQARRRNRRQSGASRVLDKGLNIVTSADYLETDYGKFRGDSTVAPLRYLCCDENGIQTGPFGSQLHQRDYVQVGTPIITVEHLGENRVIHRDMPYVSDDDRDRLSRYVLRQGDIVFSRVGSVDRRSLVREEEDGWLFSGRCLRVRPDTRKIDPAFLSYFFGLPAFREHIRSIAVGATMPSLNTQILSNVSVVYPTLPEQRYIAHILGTLDDKIELNRRMNRTLEEMARAIFKDWFIDFGPTRAKVEGRDPYLPAEVWDLFPDSLVDSELGEIPKGWCAKPLSSYGKIITGKTPSTRNPEFYGEDVPFLKIPDMHGQMYVTETGTMLSEVGADSQPTKDLPSGSVSVSCIATPGLVVLNHRRTHTNQQINSLVPDDQHSSIYLYWHCRQLSDQIFSVGSGGSVFHNMNKSTFSALRILDAGRDIPYSFDKYVSNIHKKILSNENQTHMLKLQRDALLPRLISGDLPIVDH